MSKRILITLIVLIIGTLAGLGAYFLITQFIKPQVPAYTVKYSSSNEQNFIGRGLCKRLDFNNQQKERAQSLENRYRQTISFHLIQLDSLRGEMIRTIIENSKDTLTLSEIANAIGHHHAQMKQISISHITQIRAICSEEQSQKLNSMLDELLSNPQYGNKKLEQRKRKRYRGGRN